MDEKNKFVEMGLENLGQRLKELRKAKGYKNYEKFAYDHDIARAQYGRYEKGSDLRFGTLLKIIESHGLTVAEFFAEGFDDGEIPKKDG